MNPSASVAIVACGATHAIGWLERYRGRRSRRKVSVWVRHVVTGHSKTTPIPVCSLADVVPPVTAAVSLPRLPVSLPRHAPAV